MHSMSSFVLLFLFKALIKESLAIRLISLVIPKEVIINGNATFVCNYILESDHLYSLKWYKRINDSDEEFFSYILSTTSMYHSYALPGIHLDVEKSSEVGDVLYLYNIDLTSEGLYKCEVSADHTFQTVKLESYLTVLVPPTKPPQILGVKTHYSVGDTFSAYCFSSFSKPKSHLSWYINEDEAPYFYLINFNDTSSAIQFKLEKNHFVKNKLRLKCMASINTTFQMSSKEAVFNGSDATENAPQITGLESNYKIGDYLDINCTIATMIDQSSYSQLQWFIHNEKANTLFVKRYPIKNTIGLRFRIMPYHLDDNSSLLLKCSATQVMPSKIEKTYKLVNKSNDSVVFKKPIYLDLFTSVLNLLFNYYLNR